LLCRLPLSALGSYHHQGQIFKIVAAVMQLGNIDFDVVPVEMKEDASCVSDDTKACFERCARLLQVDEEMLTKALTTKRIQVHTEWITVGLSKDKSLDLRDGITKMVYSQLFEVSGPLVQQVSFIYTNTDYCLPTLCTWIPTTSTS
jgi:myosin heavy subunit